MANNKKLPPGENIKRWMQKDTDMLHAIGRTGHFTERHFREMNIPPDRVLKHQRDERIEYRGRDSKTGDKIYRLTDIGKEKAVETGFKKGSFYQEQGVEKNMNFQHDMKFADVYCSMDKCERDTFFTEKDVRKMFDERMESIRVDDPGYYAKLKPLFEDGKFSMPDGGYYDQQGNLHFVEVITATYKQSTIDAKCSTAVFLGGEMHMYAV